MVSPLTTDGRHRRNNNSNNRVAQLGTRRISLRPTNGVLAAQLFRSPFPNQPLRSGPKPLLGPRKQSKCIQVLMEQGRKHLEEPRRQQHLNELLDDLIEESSPSQPLLPQKRQLDSFNLCATGVVKTLGTPWGGKVGQRLWVSPTSDRSVRRRTNPSTTTVVMTRATTTTTTTTGRASTLDTTSFQQNARTMDDRAAASSTASSLSSPLGTSKQPAQRRPALDEDDSVASSSEKENVPAGTIGDNQDELPVAEPNNHPELEDEEVDNSSFDMPMQDVEENANHDSPMPDGDESEEEDDDDVVKGLPKRRGPAVLDEDDANATANENEHENENEARVESSMVADSSEAMQVQQQPQPATTNASAEDIHAAILDLFANTRCVQCKALVMVDPVVTKVCRHSYCSGCFDHLKQQGMHCTHIHCTCPLEHCRRDATLTAQLQRVKQIQDAMPASTIIHLERIFACREEAWKLNAMLELDDSSPSLSDDQKESIEALTALYKSNLTIE